MKRFSILALLVIVLVAIAWQNRLDILVYVMPKALSLLKPVAPNREVKWTKGPIAAVASPDERPPNIVFILADDMGYNDVSMYNGGAADGSLLTPHIDGIGKAGVKFEAGYAGNAVCAPSRASIMTGRYSTRFGFEFTPFPPVGATLARWNNQLSPGNYSVLINEEAIASLPPDPIRSLGMPASEETVAETLSTAGYYCAHIGKWHLGYENGMAPHEQGFHDSLNMAGLLYDLENSPDIVNAKLPSMVDKMVWASAQFAVSFNGKERFQPSKYLTDYFTDEAIRVIDLHRHHPFFLFLSHWAVHNPLQATKRDYDALARIQDHDMRVYAGMIRALDRSVERVVEALRRNGLEQNTLVVFTADNGAAGYLGLQGLNKPFRGWKLTHFEGGYRVPYAAKWPARIPAGTVFSSPISHVDLLPTFAAASGAILPRTPLDGVDWLPFVTEQGEKRELKPHSTLFWKEGHLESVWHEGWKLIRCGRPRKVWLFDMGADPTEQTNLAQQHPRKVQELQALIDAHDANLPTPGWPNVLQMPQLIDRASVDPGKEITDDDEYIYWPN